jgi:tail tube protein
MAGFSFHHHEESTMSSQFPNGTIFAVSTVLGAPIVVSDISNANPAVASAAAPPSDDSIVLINSNWPDINERIAKTDNADSASFELLGINTLDDDRFEPGEGEGSVRVASAFVNLSQVTETSKSGGEQQFYTWQYLEDRSSRQRQKPTFKNAKVINVTLDYDPALAWYAALDTLDKAQELIVLRATLPNGAQMFYPVYPSFDADPSLTMNENMKNIATFSLNGEMTRYEATP